MLRIEGLTAAYDGPPALSDVSLHVDKGEILGLLGANNSGKSTLINCISGLVRPLAGCISFEGADITRLKPHERVANGIVQVPEGRQVFPQMSVLENLLLGGTSRGARSHRSTRLDQAFALFPRLAERRPQLAGTLSGGEQQMLAIGRALMSGPRLLMLDEPSLGLSPLFVQIIFKALGELNKEGLTLLLIEQNLTLTLAYASRGVVLERGQIAIEGTREMLKGDPRTRAAYLGL
ncbi:MAG: branched-chain amino acid transport system ATP-binding protein [Methylobacteriaceae bacterium]|jgi:branched-chain amino acid transport system ATP-binding protein|nr:branched-chain amino acid transport system ATP-binding protein [Methylobacteriaceae bacterium]